MNGFFMMKIVSQKSNFENLKHLVLYSHNTKASSEDISLLVNLDNFDSLTLFNTTFERMKNAQL